MGNAPSKDGIGPGSVVDSYRQKYEYQQTVLEDTLNKFSSKKSTIQTLKKSIPEEEVSSSRRASSISSSQHTKSSDTSHSANLPSLSPTSDHSSQRSLEHEEDNFLYEYGAEKERDRQTRQHYVLKKVFKGNIHVELKEPKRILETACGAGLWAIEMAQAYPDCKVTGIDIVSPFEKEGWQLNFSAGQKSLESFRRVKFEYGNICQYPLNFPDGEFDMVYQRDVASVLPFKLWPTLLSEFLRVLKPGGKIELVEYDVLFSNPGPVLSQVNEWYKLAAEMIGGKTDYSYYLENYLIEAGFINVKVHVFDIPIGEWPASEEQKQYGYLYKEQKKALFKSMKRWWCNQIKVSEEEYDRMCRECVAEFDTYHSFGHWKILTAEKP